MIVHQPLSAIYGDVEGGFEMPLGSLFTNCICEKTQRKINRRHIFWYTYITSAFTHPFTISIFSIHFALSIISQSLLTIRDLPAKIRLPNQLPDRLNQLL